MRKFLAPVAVGLVLLVSACTPTVDNGDSASDSPATPTSSQPATSPSSSSVPSSSPAPTSPANEPISTSTIYDLCIDVSAEFLAPGDPGNVSHAPESEATTLVRDDGYVAIYIEIVDGNNASSAEAAISCVAGGTVAAPFWYNYGVATRAADATEIDRQLRTVANA